MKMVNNDIIESLCKKIENCLSCGCFQRAFIFMATYLHKNYELLFLKQWNFDYNASCLLNEYIFDVLYDVGRFHKISIETIELRNSQELNEYIYEYCENKNIPICIDIDAYYCDWYKEYGKVHRIKYLIIWGRINEKYYYIDLSNNYSRNYLISENIIQDYKVVNCFLYMPICKQEYLQKLEHVLDNHLKYLLLKDKGLNRICKYADQLSVKDILYQLNDGELFANNFFINLEVIILARENLSIFFDYYENIVKKSFTWVHSRIKEILDLWLKFKNVCIKCKIIHNVGQSQYDFVKTILYSICEKELKLVMDIQLYISTKN